MAVSLDSTGPKGGVSGRRARANAENARRSTGPRTEAGKRKSAMNALTHGGYATHSVAISRGPFAEDPDELDDYIRSLVDSLHPRDLLEHEEATRIALCYVHFRRLCRYETAILSEPRASDHYHAGALQHPTLEDLVDKAHACAVWLLEHEDVG